MAEIIKEIIRIEGPIHVDEVTNRVKALWGYSRAGSRIQAAVNNAVGALASSDQCQWVDGFLFLLGAPVKIRNRENISSADLRRPEMICPMEIREAIFAVIDLGRGAGAREISTAVARLFGFKSTSAQLRYSVENQIHKLSTINKIVEVNGLLKRA